MMAVPPVHASKLPSPKIPFASIPRFLNRTFPFILTVGAALWLVVLLILDVHWSCRRKSGHFIPGKHLILGALSLQLLGVVLSPIASISSDERKLDSAVVMELSATIHNKRVLIVVGRVVMCVLIGIMLPHVAGSGAKNRRSDMLTLLISAVGVLFHISYEDYINEAKTLTHDVNYKHIRWNLLSQVTDSIIYYSIIFLIFLLAFTALISNSIRKDVAHKLPVMMSPVECGNTAGLMISWEEADEKLVQSWITARTSQIQYIIARSTLTSSTSFIVTLCVVSFILESYHKNGYTPVQWSFLLWIVIISQWIFILMGWAIVSWRCILAVVYYPRRTDRKERLAGLWAFFRSEASYQRRRVYDGLLELVHEQPFSCLKLAFKWLLQEYPKSFMKRALKTLVDVLVYPVLLISIICWLILESVFSNRYILKLVMRLRRDYVEISELDDDADFHKYRRNLMDMPRENLEGLWIANRKFIAMGKALFREGEVQSHQCTALISLLTKNTSHVLGYVRDPFSLEVESGFPKRTPKMMAVTLLTVIMELSAFYGSPNANTDCIHACCNAWKIMEFVERKDQEADIIFHDLIKWNMWLGLTLPMNKFKDRTMEKAKTALVELAEKGADHMHLKESTIYDPLNRKASIAVQNLRKVYESIRDCSVDNLEEMFAVIQSSLADVIRACVFKMRDTIMKDCRLDAEADMEEEEEKLLNVLYVAGMAKGITMKLHGPVAELHTISAAELHTRPLHGRPPSSVDMSP